MSSKVDYFLHLLLDPGETKVREWEQLSTEPVYDPITREVSSVYAYNEALRECML